jgi:hypothetical protein
MSILALLAASAVTAAPACIVPPAEKTAQLSLGYSAFDSRPGRHGWRNLAANGCPESAIELLEAYLQGHRHELSGEQQREAAFHMGQTYALAGREAQSLPYFERAQSAAASAEWQTYVAATLAFLRRDRSALESAYAAYAAISPGSMRLRIIAGLVACPAEPYAEAVHCRM